MHTLEEIYQRLEANQDAIEASHAARLGYTLYGFISIVWLLVLPGSIALARLGVRKIWLSLGLLGSASAALIWLAQLLFPVWCFLRPCSDAKGFVGFHWITSEFARYPRRGPE